MIVATPTLAPGFAPVETALATVRRRRGVGATRGLVPGLVVPDGAPGWLPARALVSGDRLGELLDAAAQRWAAPPHVAAALAWRSYTYWLAMPVVLGWATARRVPMLAPDNVLVRVSEQPASADGAPLVTVGLRRLRLAVHADDPLAVTGGPDLTVLSSEQELRQLVRSTLRDAHLDPLLARIQERVRLGTRTLLGSLASAVAYAAVRGLQAPPAEVTATAESLLSALDVADLVTFEPGPGGPTVRRRTCCLAFNLPEPKICSGCCIRP